MPSYKELIDQKKSYKIYFSKFYGMFIFYTEKSQEKLPFGLFFIERKFSIEFGKYILFWLISLHRKKKLTSIAFLSWLISASIFFSAWSRWRSCNSSLLVKVNLSVLNAKESDVNLFYKLKKRKNFLIKINKKKRL